MEQTVNKVYAPLFVEKPRYFIFMGGRGAGRSTAASQYANAKLTSDEYFRGAIMRYVLSDVRKSIYQEIIDRADENGVRDKLDINDNAMTIAYARNLITAMGFRKSSGDQKAKLKSLANYNVVIIEEADEIPEQDFMQLDDSLRTLKGDIIIILLLNPPPKTHWIIKRFFDTDETPYKGFYKPKLKPDAENTIFIHSTFLDNIKNLSPQTVENYRRYEHSKPDHFYNMILGLVPETVRGKIYTNWQVIDKIPPGARLERHWTDFGYTNDPTAIGDLYYYNGAYILDERTYTKGLSNKQIADILLNAPGKVLTIADSAEPKSIDEIASYGVPIMAAEKGQGSINQGIQLVQSQTIFVTRRSVNILEEMENYAWLEDSDGNTMNEPIPIWNHHMDGIRYAVGSLAPVLREKEALDNLPKRSPKKQVNRAR